MSQPVEYFIPTRKQVQSLKVGSWALNVYGVPAEVAEICAQRDNIEGKAFVVFYTKTSATSQISGEYVEDELVRTLAITSKHNSAECAAIEARMVRERTAANGAV